MNRTLLSIFAGLSLLLIAAPAMALSLGDVKEMHSVGVPDSIIIQTIENSDEVFNLGAKDIIALKQAGVSDDIIAALQATAGGESRTTDTREAEDAPPAASSESERPRRERATEDDEDRPRRRSSRDDESSRRSDDDDSLIRRRSRGDDDRKKRSSSSSRVKRTPKEIKGAISNYKEKKYLTASLKLFLLLEAGKYPEQEAKVHYYLGAALKQMGLLHSAQYYFQKVVKEGPGTGPLFSSSLQKMVDISDKTKDPIYLIRTIDKIDQDDYPGKVKDDLYYYQGVRDFERKDFTRAKRNFAKLGKSSRHYIQARYQIGVIYNSQDRKKAAIRTFADIVKGNFNGDPKTIAEVKQLSYINMARIRYGVEQYERAAGLYGKLPRLTKYWGTSLYESAWAHFMGENREHKALGQLLSVRSPFFDRTWIPESAILEALTFYRICEYQEVQAILDEFKATNVPIQETISTLLEPYKAGEKRFPALYQQLYGTDSTDFRKLPTAIYAHIEGNRKFAGPHNRVLQIERELERIKTLKPQWRDSEVGTATVKLLRKQRKVYMKFAGVALANELGAVNDQLADLMGQEALIRFEVVSGEYEKYERAFRNPEVAEVDEGVEFDFATNPDVIFWPFNDEFWQDELGFYERVEPGDCKE